MSARERTYWDDVYRERGKTQPRPINPLLLKYTPPILKQEIENPKRALDLAAGFGQNGLWLAAVGYIADLMDISLVALKYTREEIAIRQLSNVNLFQVDLDEADLDESKYDLICVFRYTNRDLLPRIRAAIVPGGRIIYETPNTDYLQVKPDLDRKQLFVPGELAGYFDNWNILHSSDVDYHSQLVAVKPDDSVA
jgi:tellurite methyltransferase